MKQRSNKSSSRHKQELKAPASRSAKSEPGSVLSPRRKWAFRLFALTVLPLLLLGGLEAALRLAGYGYATSFFKPARIGNEDYFIQNDDFGLRFFPKETARNPGACSFAAGARRCHWAKTPTSRWDPGVDWRVSSAAGFAAVTMSRPHNHAVDWPLESNHIHRYREMR